MNVSIVIPCFNEARRLDEAALLTLLAAPDWRLVFVNDGSTDETHARLDALAALDGRVDVLHLERNCGKAEAVRQGLLRALPQAAVVGYFDADLATPPAEMVRVINALEASGVAMAMGARVGLLGRDIQRSPTRHYLGRVFASLASLSLNLRVYDTQCGAKALRVDDRLASALARPFTSRWVFDVELIARLRDAGVPEAAFVEVPLMAWRDVKGSKLGLSSMARSLVDLARIARR
jgi:glycosyltransferase involved in cell wall biosynthesis